jgi:D-alanyl-D-alanine carboxypeptidase
VPPLLLMVVALVPAGPAWAQEELPAIFEDVPAPPAITATAAYAFDVSAGVPLYAFNADERLPPASLTKIATALVVLERIELDEQVLILASDLVEPEFSNMSLVANDVLTVEQLLYGLFLPSGNDAANALARTVGAELPGGDPTDAAASIAAFVDAMNELVGALGLENTHFVDPAGLDDPEQYSSARDLTRLAQEALESQTLAEIAETTSIELTSVGPEERAYPLENTNKLLGLGGVHGLKTGTTPLAGACLVTAAWFHGPNRVITVVLGSAEDIDAAAEDPSVNPRFADTEAILGGLEKDYTWLSPTDKDDIKGLGEELAAWQVTLKDGPAVVVPSAELDRFRYKVRLGPEGPPNSKVGRVLFLVGSVVVAERTLYQAEAASGANATTEQDDTSARSTEIAA